MGMEDYLMSGKIRLDQQLKFSAEIDKMTAGKTMPSIPGI